MSRLNCMVVPSACTTDFIIHPTTRNLLVFCEKKDICSIVIIVSAAVFLKVVYLPIRRVVFRYL